MPEPQDLNLVRSTVAVYSDPQFAAKYFAQWRADFPRIQLDLFSRRLGSTGKVLDAGCGPGHHSMYLYELGHEVIGIDLADAALRLARENFPGPIFGRMNMLSTDFATGEFSGVWACASIMHVPKSLLPSQIAEFSRVLRQNGLLALTLTVEAKAHLDAFGRFFEAHTRAELTSALSGAGFDLVDEENRIRDTNTVQDGDRPLWTTITARKH